MATKLDYLNNTYLFESEAEFIEIRENEKGKAVILKETIFYPQGGGQPFDVGEVVSAGGAFIVKDVRLDEYGTVWHFGEFIKGDFHKGDKVVLKIDRERRIMNSKLHSAGHLLDCAVSEMNIKDFHPVKGFHFPEGAYVEYEGTIENVPEAIGILQERVDRLTLQNPKIFRKTLSADEAELCGMHAPAGKPVIVVNFEGFSPCGCGGTHVNDASEIGKIRIRKIKSSGGITKISYLVE